MDDLAAAFDVAGNLLTVRQRIAQACAACDRSPDEVSLIAVSKGQPVVRIAAALDAGQLVFGENYVQEAASRWPALRNSHGESELHLIGALQTNKAEEAARLFDVIQTLDRPKLAAALARAFTKLGATRRLMVEVNIGQEPQKAGILPDQLDTFIAQCRSEYDLPIEGLMAIPPAEAELGPHGAYLAKLAARNGLTGVSIGMSADYEAAIRAGATHVRVGTAIFGVRPPRA